MEFPEDSLSIGKGSVNIQKGRTEIMLKEHPGRADLPVPHYSPSSRSSLEMALSADH